MQIPNAALATWIIAICFVCFLLFGANWLN
jgi:hypothetical protein